MKSTSIQDRVELNISDARANLVARVDVSIKRVLAALEQENFPGALLHDVYRKVEKTTRFLKRRVSTFKLDKGTNGNGVACWGLNKEETWLLLADGNIATYGYTTDRVLAELSGCKPTENFAVVELNELSDDLLERLIEKLGELELKTRSEKE